MRRPGDESKEPDGGRAAERLREFLRDRQPTTGAEEKTGSDQGCDPADGPTGNTPVVPGSKQKGTRRSSAKKR